MKIAQYNDMMSYLTRPEFSGGSGKKPTTLEELKKSGKITTLDKVERPEKAKLLESIRNFEIKHGFRKKNDAGGPQIVEPSKSMQMDTTTSNPIPEYNINDFRNDAEIFVLAYHNNALPKADIIDKLNNFAQKGVDAGTFSMQDAGDMVQRLMGEVKDRAQKQRLRDVIIEGTGTVQRDNKAIGGGVIEGEDLGTREGFDAPQFRDKNAIKLQNWIKENPDFEYNKFNAMEIAKKAGIKEGDLSLVMANRVLRNEGKDTLRITQAKEKEKLFKSKDFKNFLKSKNTTFEEFSKLPANKKDKLYLYPYQRRTGLLNQLPDKGKNYITALELSDLLKPFGINYGAFGAEKDTLLAKKINELLDSKVVKSTGEGMFGAQKADITGDRGFLFFKKPTKSQLQEIAKFKDAPNLRTNTVEAMKVLHKKLYNTLKNKKFPTLEKVQTILKNANLGDSPAQAARAMSQLARVYGGTEFQNDFGNIKADKATSKFIVKEFGEYNLLHPWRRGVYVAALDDIKDAIGDEAGDLKKFKNRFDQFLLKKYPGTRTFDLNEVFSVTASARNKSYPYAYFVDVIDSNLNQVDLAAFHGNMSLAEERLSDNIKKYRRTGNIKFYNKAKEIADKFNNQTRKSFLNTIKKNYPGESFNLTELKIGKPNQVLDNINFAGDFYKENKLKKWKNLGIDIGDHTAKAGYIKTGADKKGVLAIQELFTSDYKVDPSKVDDFVKNISKKTNVPVEEVGKDLTNVQKVIRKMQGQMNSGIDPKLLVEYLGAEVKDLAAFGQKYGGDVLAKVGKGAAGVDLPIFQTMFGSMYDIEQDSPLWLTIPAAFTDEVANLYGLYNKSEGRFGLGKVKDFGKFVASSFVPRAMRSPIFKAVSKVGKAGTLAGPLLEAGAGAYRFEKMKDARDDAIRQFDIPIEIANKGFRDYIRSTVPQDAFDELNVPESPGLPRVKRGIQELASMVGLADNPYEIQKVRGDITGTGITSPMALQRLYDRQGLVEGGPPDPSKRTFLKLLSLIPAGVAGLASLRFGPKKIKNIITKIEKLKNTKTLMPDWFPSFVDKFRKEGKAENMFKKNKIKVTEQEYNQAVAEGKNQNYFRDDARTLEYKANNPDHMDFYKLEDSDQLIGTTYTNDKFPGVNIDDFDGEVQVNWENDYSQPVNIVYVKPGGKGPDVGRPDKFQAGIEKQEFKPQGEFSAMDQEVYATDPDGGYDTEAVIVDSLDDMMEGTTRMMEEYATGKKVKNLSKGEGKVIEAEVRANQMAEEVGGADYEGDPINLMDDRDYSDAGFDD